MDTFCTNYWSCWIKLLGLFLGLMPQGIATLPAGVNYWWLYYLLQGKRTIHIRQAKSPVWQNLKVFARRANTFCPYNSSFRYSLDFLMLRIREGRCPPRAPPVRSGHSLTRRLSASHLNCFFIARTASNTLTRQAHGIFVINGESTPTTEEVNIRAIL